MTTIYTTQRCLTVEEDYDTIWAVLTSPNKGFFEFTEVRTHTPHSHPLESTISKRKVSIQTDHIVEFAEND